MLGRIPANRLYRRGLAILSRYPLPEPDADARARTTTTSSAAPARRPPVVKICRSSRRSASTTSCRRSCASPASTRASAQRVLTTPGIIPGFTDVLHPYPFITNYAVTANYTLNPTTFLEGTYGFIRNELAGGNENGILMNDSANRLNRTAGLPAPLSGRRHRPEATRTRTRSWRTSSRRFWDGTRMNLPPNFSWGGRIGALRRPEPALPRLAEHQPDAGRRDQLTKVAGRHTIKGGLLQQPQLQGAERGAGGTELLPGLRRTSTTTPTTRSTPASAMPTPRWACSRQYPQASKFVEGSMLYNNTEGYMQDNWKVNSRLTLDYGLRFTHQQPQYDQFQQMSNFFPDQWTPSQAPVLYVPGCSNGAAPAPATPGTRWTRAPARF